MQSKLSLDLVQQIFDHAAIDAKLYLRKAFPRMRFKRNKISSGIQTSPLKVPEKIIDPHRSWKCVGVMVSINSEFVRFWWVDGEKNHHEFVFKESLWQPKTFLICTISNQQNNKNDE